MSRRCTICDHAQRDAIDAALMGNDSLRTIADRWRVSKTALLRHKADHLPEALTKAEQAKEVTHVDNLLGQLLALNRETMTILREARKEQDNELALKAIARAEKQIELQARLLGELQEGQTVNILVQPEWIQTRNSILQALGDFPNARIAVAEALVKMEGANGHDRA